MIPFAAANRVRLILVNRRDYPGSTPLSDVELAELGSPDLETRAKALAQQGLDMGLFLAWLVREENIPPVSIDRDGKQQGGIALVAWSLAHTPLGGVPRARRRTSRRRTQGPRSLPPGVLHLW